MNNPPKVQQAGAELTYDDIRQKKQEVLAQIRQKHAEMQGMANELFSDYGSTQHLLSVQGVKKISGWVGGAIYGYRLVRSVLRVTRVLKKH